MLHNIESLKPRRRELRQNQTRAEKILWRFLRGSRMGVKFKRQHSVGGYILDFYCSEKKLVIELDGEVHDTVEAIEYDKIRDKYFKDLGYTVLRFKNWKVEKELGRVLEEIGKCL